ncbi:MAG: Trypsin [uncultured Sulfurovum sp.]|uniref:Trypsin n=1 Tax=uncultured Sulfurovum sp. TaxID=269237 RepID=A0A6S6UG44_9BACT|nr:MAG: Trypsin [uncultured Sulfurovum sp.]
MNLVNFRLLLPLSFFIFIGFIIYLADSADHNFAFRLIGDIPYGDKLMHTLLYGVMALLLNYGLNFKSKKIFGFNLQIGALIVLTFAGLEELSQYWLPSRTCDVVDFVADVVGVVLFSFIHWKQK